MLRSFALAGSVGLLCAAAVAFASATYPSGSGTVYVSGDAYKFVAGVLDRNGVAFGNFSDPTAHPSAFGSLRIATNAKYNATTQMFAAGYLEGALTQVRVFEHFTNMYNWTLRQTKSTELPTPVAQYFEQQYAWMRQTSASNTSALWVQVGNLLAQFDGLLAGYNSVAPAAEQLTEQQLQVLNAAGDMDDIVDAVMPSLRPDWEHMTAVERDHAIAKYGHCSAIVKLTGNFSDMFASHSTWFTYEAMLRIYKHYELQLDSPSTNCKAMSFSSYPGMLSSWDDFYMMHDTKLVMLETTNDVYNMSLYQFVVPHTLSAWHRVRLANIMATSGQEWTSTVAQHNSGTYNNQYMIVDYKLFTPGSGLVANTLWVAEQIPGLVVSADVTQELERGYWPSYNVPYFPEIYAISGYPTMMKQFSKTGGVSGLNYQTAPRAEIFRRDQDDIVDMTTLKTFMRSNAYRTDPYSGGDPWHAICSRGDLDGAYDGCIDTKITSYSWFQSGLAAAVSGPTTAGGTLPEFVWPSVETGMSHVGQPTAFNFDFENQQFQSLL